jgi:hypothetical protein
MTKNPLLNALGAAGYILLVVSLMTFVFETQSNKPDTFFAPVVMLSLLTLSVAVMAYAFFYQPLQLLLAGKKKEATQLFVHTVSIFAALTVAVLALVFMGIL